MVEVSLGRIVTLMCVELAPGGYEVMEPLGYLDTWCHPVRINFFITTIIYNVSVFFFIPFVMYLFLYPVCDVLLCKESQQI